MRCTGEADDHPRWGRLGDGHRADSRSQCDRSERPVLDHRRRATQTTPFSGNDNQAAQDAAGQPAEVSPDADPRDGEGQEEVDPEDHPDLPGDVVEASAPGYHEGRAEDAEDGSGGPDGVDQAAREEQGSERAGEQRGEVDRDEPWGSDRGLEDPAEEEQGDHVEGKVEDRYVEEPAGDQPVPLAVSDEDPPQAEVVDRRTGPGGYSARAGGDLEEIGKDAETDQELGGRVATGGSHGRPRNDPGLLPGTVGTPHPDRSGSHAVGADRASAARAGDSGLDSRVAVALGHPDQGYGTASAARRPVTQQ